MANGEPPIGIPWETHLYSKCEPVETTPVYIRDGQHDYEIIRRSLLIFKDGLIRHDPKQIQAVISDLVKEL